CKVRRHIGEAGVVERSICREWIVIDVSACGVQHGVVNVPDSRRGPAGFRVVGEITVAHVYQNLRRRCPVSAEAVNGKGIDDTDVRTERRRVDGRTRVGLTEGTIRGAELSI